MLTHPDASANKTLACLLGLVYSVVCMVSPLRIKRFTGMVVFDIHEMKHNAMHRDV